MSVQLYCTKVGSKLRVRVQTAGYLRHANCQFPRDLRVDGRRFEVDPSAISLITTRGKYFYAVKNKNAIRILPSGGEEITTGGDGTRTLPQQIFTDDSTEDCIICMETPKVIVFNPCGHFYACETCSTPLKQCPICRITLTGRIHCSEFGTDD